MRVATSRLPHELPQCPTCRCRILTAKRTVFLMLREKFRGDVSIIVVNRCLSDPEEKSVLVHCDRATGRSAVCKERHCHTR